MVVQYVSTFVGTLDFVTGQGFPPEACCISLEGEAALRITYVWSDISGEKAPNLTTSPSWSRFSAYRKKFFVVWSSLSPPNSMNIFLFYLSLLAYSFIALICIEIHLLFRGFSVDGAGR